MCTTLADTISILQESIYTEAANIFGHFQLKKRNLAEQIDELSCPFNLFNKRTCFWLKLNQFFIP